MLSHLRLKFGGAPGSPVVSLPLTPVTVFVGPNNSGKSLALKEIADLTHGYDAVSRYIIDAIQAQLPSRADARSMFSLLALRPEPDDHADSMRVMKRQHRGGRGAFRLSPSDLEECFNEKPREVSSDVREWKPAGVVFLSAATLVLDGSTRLALLSSASAGDLLYGPENLLMALFNNRDARQRIRAIAHEAFDQYVVIDPTNLGRLRVRLSDRPPQDELEEQALDGRARTFHAAAREIDDFSDGVRAFIGIIATVIGGHDRVFLIDEPEAFLHPALTFRLGLELSRAANSRPCSLLIATHSADFLMGCIQSGVPLNIIRLTYQRTHAGARLLPASALRAMMHDPLLRSTGVLGALFRPAVAVAEADSDRAFYFEVNERLLAAGRTGAPQCLFLNAHNKQTIWGIVRPLREIGVPTAGIVDIDVIKQGGIEWTRLLKAALIPEALHSSLHNLRQVVNAAFEATSKDMKREGGRGLLPRGDQEACDKLIRDLAEYGVFVVPGGELESWLPHLGASGHGLKWLPRIFEAMGSEPEDPAYVRPGAGDVWEFMERVGGWLNDEQRKGMPD